MYGSLMVRYLPSFLMDAAVVREMISDHGKRCRQSSDPTVEVQQILRSF